MKPLVAAGTAGAASLALIAGLWLATTGTDGDSSANAAASPTGPVVNTSLGLPSPTGDPELPALRELNPKPGSVGRLVGPFDDRFETSGVTFDGRALRGRITITSDVSEILALQVLAGLYDDTGAYLGQARWDFVPPEAHAEGHPEESVRFEVVVPKNLRAKVSAASYGVTNLVNE